MQKSRMIVSGLVFGLAVATAMGQDRGGRTEKGGGVSFHVVSTVPASGYDQVTFEGQSYFVAPQAMIRADQITSVQSNASSLTLAGSFPASTKANQLGVLVDGNLVAVGSLSLQNGQATLTGLTPAQSQRVTSLLGRKGGSPTGAAFSVVPAGQVNGEYVFDVYVQNVPGLRTYQVKLEASGGTAGALNMTDVVINDTRPDYVFGTSEAVKAADQGGQRLGGTLFSSTVDVTAPAYVGTWKFRPTADAAGTFNINVVTGTESFVADVKNQNLPVGAVNATVQVGSKARLSD